MSRIDLSFGCLEVTSSVDTNNEVKVEVYNAILSEVLEDVSYDEVLEEFDPETLLEHMDKDIVVAFLENQGYTVEK